MMFPKVWNWFCRGDVWVHSRDLTVLWNRNASKPNRGKGLMFIFSDIGIAGLDVGDSLKGDF